MSSLKQFGCEVVAVTPRDDATPRLADLNVRWREWKMEGQAANPIKDLRSIVQLRSILSDERPDAVMNFTVKPVLYGSLVAGSLGVPRVISMITGMGSLFLPGGLNKRLLLSAVKVIYRAAMRCNHSVLFQNDEDFEYFVEHRFIPRSKGHRINGSGVNLDKFSKGSEEVRKGSFLLISRMIREKGVFQFVEAARVVKQTYPQANFVLLGPIDNNPGAITREQIRAWEEQGVVEYVGVQSDVRPFLARAEVYVLPTYYLEGVPRSILEALAMGKPVITTDWRGCRDTVVPDVNGFLVPPVDAAALASSMRRFLDDPSLASRMGKASRRLAEERFDVDIVNATVIRELIARA